MEKRHLREERNSQHAHPSHPPPEPVTVGSQIALSDDAANHVGRVLRMGKGRNPAFDGSNQVFDAVIAEAGKKKRVS